MIRLRTNVRKCTVGTGRNLSQGEDRGASERSGDGSRATRNQLP
jgi:hypothetical protein